MRSALSVEAKPKTAAGKAARVPVATRFAARRDGTRPRADRCACGGGCPRCRRETERPALQTKLKVSAPGDQYEQEADRAAEQVMRMTEPRAAPVNPVGTAPAPQRKCGACEREEGGEDELVQPKESPGQSPRPAAGVEHRIDSLRGGGEPLSAPLREFFEPRFGYDFGRVRVHTGGPAAESAESIDALAYTSGRDVVFAPGQYAPETESGMRLLAHELTHVVQQGEAGARDLVQRQSDVRELPAALPCVTVTGPGHPAGGTTITFSSGTTVSAAGVTDIAAFHTSWAAAGGRDEVSIDGFASTAGSQADNWKSSCKRAEEVKRRLEALGVPAIKITTFAHGESTEFSTTSSAANQVAVIHSGSRLAATDLTIDRVERRGPPDSIFFERGSSTILAGPQADKIAALAAGTTDLTLFGFTSEDESGGLALADARIRAVDDALAGRPPLSIATPHAKTRTPDTANAVTAGRGQLDYRNMRKVVVRPTGTPSGVSNCGAGPAAALVTCAPSSVFTDAQTRAGTLLGPAITALSSLSAANRTLFDRHFHTTAANRTATAALVKKNLEDLRTHISTQMTPTSTLGPAPTFTPRPGHRCANACDANCAGGASAYNNKVDADAVMTLCDTPTGFVQEPDVDERAATLIHEGLHGITLQVGPVGAIGSTAFGTDDFSYIDQRLIRFLDPATALRNTDTYVAFVRELAGHVIAVGRGTVVTVPLTSMKVVVPQPDPATGAAMSAAERLDVDRAIAWLEGWIIWAAGETNSLYGHLNKSIAAGSWTNSYYESTMKFLAPRFGLLPVPADWTKKAVAAIAERFARMEAVLFSTSPIKINRVTAGATTWSAGPGFDVDIGPDFFAVPAGAGHDRAQLEILLRAIITATTGVSADAVTRYMDLVDQIRKHQGGGTP